MFVSSLPLGAHGTWGLCLLHLYILGQEAACLFSDCLSVWTEVRPYPFPREKIVQLDFYRFYMSYSMF